uniref:Uncharacterized protein n=1 Tax=Cacopsylla melanoneura TaxID=428564 RepID=A0A8D8RS33_9HEMI
MFSFFTVSLSLSFGLSLSFPVSSAGLRISLHFSSLATDFTQVLSEALLLSKLLTFFVASLTDFLGLFWSELLDFSVVSLSLTFLLILVLQFSLIRSKLIRASI